MMHATENPIIPEGELKCVWMEAGIVGYKLCDREFQCERCPFDEDIRRHHEVGLNDPSDESAPRQKKETRQPEGARSAEEWFQNLLDEYMRSFNDMELPGDRQYFRNHTWIKKSQGNAMLIGVDHLAVLMLGTIGSVVLPFTPTHTERNSPCVWLVHREGAMGIRSPLGGTILQSNDRLKHLPFLVSTSPYDDGWLFSLSCDDSAAFDHDAMNANDAIAEYKVQGTLLCQQFGDVYKRSRSHVGITLYDGGTKMPTIQEIIGRKIYFDVIGRLFKLK